MRIAICDDDATVIERTASMLDDIDAEVFKFTDGNEFLSHIENGETFNIVFLDIEMPEISGFEIADVLMKRNKDCILLFLTSHGQYSMKGYEYRAFRYVLKSEPENFLKRNIDDAIKEYETKNTVITIKSKEIIKNIPTRDILYFESKSHDTIVHTNDGKKYVWRKTISDITGILGSHSFVRCHRSYVVNLMYIDSVQGGEFAALTNGARIQIGRKYKTNLIEKYLTYIGG